MQIDLLGGSYQQKYNEFNSQRTINWYMVPTTQSEKAKSQSAMFPTPGLTLYVTLPGRYNRGLFTAQTSTGNRCFAVVDNTLYEILLNNSYINRGTLTNITIGPSPVHLMVDANNELGIFHKSASYFLNLNTNVLSQITTNQFVGLVEDIDYSDGYTFVISQGSVYFNVSSNLSTWLSTNVFTNTFTTAPVIAVKTLMEEVFIFSKDDIEIFYNDGSSPYSRLPRSTIYIGLETNKALSKIQEGFLFLGRARSGEAAVYFFDKFYNCTIISPFSINWSINKVPSLHDSYSFVQYTKDGHIWYHLTIPALKTTFVYDFMTKEWFERQSTQPFQDANGDNIQREFRVKTYTNFEGINLFGDQYSGAIFIEDFTNQTENNQPIIRTRISKTFNNEYNNISVSQLEFDCNTGYGTITGQGSNPNLMISYSNDNGYNYSNLRTLELGLSGQHIKRARLRKLGTSRNWTIKFVLSDPIDLMFQNAYTHGTIGIH